MLEQLNNVQSQPVTTMRVAVDLPVQSKRRHFDPTSSKFARTVALGVSLNCAICGTGQANVVFEQTVNFVAPSGHASKLRSPKASASPVQAFQKLRHSYLTALTAEPVLDGYDHIGSALLEESASMYPELTLRWLLELLSGTRGSASADTLRLLARTIAFGETARSALVRTALASDSSEVRDAAMQAVESWRDVELFRLLRAHTERDEWLRDYAEKLATQG
jgi:hypothetical protein